MGSQSSSRSSSLVTSHRLTAVSEPVTLWCASCRADSLFEQPASEDEQYDAASCDEWVCLGCGDAHWLGYLLADTSRAGVARDPG